MNLGCLQVATPPAVDAQNVSKKVARRSRTPKEIAESHLTAELSIVGPQIWPKPDQVS